MRKSAVHVLTLLAAVSVLSLVQAQITPPALVRQSMGANVGDMFAGLLKYRNSQISSGDRQLSNSC